VRVLLRPLREICFSLSRCLVSAGAVSLFLHLSPARADGIVGFVEETANDVAQAPGAPAKTEYETALRLAFRKTGERWTTVCSSKSSGEGEGCKFANPDTPRQWNVQYQGNALGAVTTAGWRDDKMFWRLGELRITSKPVPQVGAASDEFSGWAGHVVHRPLIANEALARSATYHWTSQTPAEADLKSVWGEYSRMVKRAPNCKADLKKPLERAEPEEARPLRPDDLEVFQVLSSNRGGKLIAVRMKRKLLEGCEEPEGVASELWFYLEKNAKPRPLLAASLEGWPYAFRLIDIIDIDNDGSDEAFFWYSGYNEDGYVLFTEDFRKQLKFTWGYH
jgi:hypothetical protein